MRGLLVLVALTAAAHADVIKPKSGAALCGALAPTDFKAVGVAMKADKPTANISDEGASAYCVYAGKSSATGGIELDVFHPAGGNAKEAKATFDTAVGEGSSAMKPIKIAGVDEAVWNPKAVSGGPEFGAIAVRRGTLVFVVGVPTSKDIETQLRKLVDLVLKRL